MISLQRKLALRAQASLEHGTERSLAALARTTQAAHSTVAVGDTDVPLVDTVQDARDSAELLPFLEDGTSLAGDDAWEAWDQSEFALDLAHQLEGELATAKADLDTALREAADALEASGLAQSEAAQAVADAAVAADAAAQAVQDALAAHQLAEGAAPSWSTVNPVAADASGKPVGAIWYVRDTAGRVIRMWELTALGWVARAFDETVIPQLAIGSGTYGTLAGDRLVAKSVTAAQIQALAITASEIASNAITAVKIAANAVTAEKISAGAVTTVKLDALAVTAEKIAVGAIIADKIAAGAITTAKLAATAIDGMTITGALVRTAASGQRVQMDAAGIRTFNQQGAETGRLTSGDGGFDLSGRANWKSSDYRQGFLSVRPPTNTDSASIYLSRGAAGLHIGASDGQTGPFAMINALDGGMELVATRQISARTRDDIYMLSSAGKIRLVSSNGISLEGPVEFQGDTDWARLDGWTGGFAQSTVPVQYRRRGGYVELKGMLRNSSWAGGLTPFGATMPPGFRPSQSESFPITSDFPGTRTAEFGANGSIRLYGSGAAPAWWSFTMVRFPTGI